MYNSNDILLWKWKGWKKEWVEWNREENNQLNTIKRCHLTSLRLHQFSNRRKELLKSIIFGVNFRAIFRVINFIYYSNTSRINSHWLLFSVVPLPLQWKHYNCAKAAYNRNNRFISEILALVFKLWISIWSQNVSGSIFSLIFIQNSSLPIVSLNVLLLFGVYVCVCVIWWLEFHRRSCVHFNRVNSTHSHKYTTVCLTVLLHSKYIYILSISFTIYWSINIYNMVTNFLSILVQFAIYFLLVILNGHRMLYGLVLYQPYTGICETVILISLLSGHISISITRVA